MKVRLLIPMVILAVSVPASAATYYFATNGDDTYSSTQAQTQATPWRSIAKLNALSLQPGDQVLLRRGDVFPGGIIISQSGTAASPITIGAYGSGSLPSVNGAVAITGWSSFQGSVFVAPYSGNPTATIEQVAASGTPLTLARTPNAGYWTMDSVIGSTTFFSSSLKGTTDWTGASIHLKTERWSLDWRVIKTHDQSTGMIVLDRAANYTLKKGWGFFINNSLGALDQAGEWYYDSTAKSLYVWMPGGNTPANIEASVTPYGIDLSNHSYISVNAVRFLYHTVSGVRATGSHLIITGCSIDYAGERGMDLTIADSRVENCDIRYPNIYGIKLYGANNTITTTSILGVGMITRLNRKGFGGGCCTGRGLDFRGGNNTITNNTLDSIGYIGIGFEGQDNLIQQNLVNHVCMTTDDGGAIYTWNDDFANPGAAGTIIRKNIVMNGVGAPDGAGEASAGWVHGIYMDDRTHDILIDSNTCINNELGIFLHNNRRHTATANVCYGNRNAQIQVQRDAIIDSTVYGNLVTNNILFSTADSQNTVTQALYQPNDSALAAITNNYECEESPFGITCRKNGTIVWTQSYYDGNTLKTGANKIVNSSFDSTTLAWGAWPSQYFELKVDSVKSPDKRSLRIRYWGDPTQGTPIVYTNKIYPLTSGKLYWLHFSAMENHKGQIVAIARLSHDTYASVGLSRQVTLDTLWQDFDLYFDCTQSDTSCRVDFQISKSDTLIWLDNVSLYEINEAGISRELHSRCFYNDKQDVQSFSLGSDSWRDVYGSRNIKGSLSLQPFLSRVLVKDSTNALSAAHISKPAPQSRMRVRGLAHQRIEVDFSLSSKQTVRLTLFNLTGRIVHAALYRDMSPGRHIIRVGPTTGATAAGMYLVALDSKGCRMVGYVVMVR